MTIINENKVPAVTLKWKALVICVVSVIAHSAVYNADFVYDDEPALLQNADVQVSS